MKILMVAVLACGSLAAQDGFQKRVDRAIAEGSAFLVGILRKPSASGLRCGESALAVLALLHCGIDKSDPAVQRGLKIMEKPAPATYDVALRLMVREIVRDPSAKPRAAKDLKWLVRGQGGDGGWRYQPNPTKSDNSCTQYAVLGLHAAREMGLKVSAKTWERLLRYLTAQISREGGTGYQRSSRPTVTMSLGALASLVIVGNQYANSPAGKKSKRVATYRKKTLDYLNTNWKLPRKWGRSYYGLYALERAMAFAGLDRLGGRDWYREGAEWILAQQKADGSWHGHVVQTAFALLFLRRATHRRGGVTMASLAALMKSLGPNATMKEVHLLVERLARRGRRLCRPLLYYLENERWTVRAAAVETLRRLTGRSFGFDPRSSTLANEAAIVSWTRHVLLTESR